MQRRPMTKGKGAAVLTAAIGVAIVGTLIVSMLYSLATSVSTTSYKDMNNDGIPD